VNAPKKTINTLDQTNQNPGYLLGRKLAVFAHAAKLAKRDASITRTLERPVILTQHIYQAESEFTRSLRGINNNFSAIRGNLQEMSRMLHCDYSQINATPEVQMAIRSGFDHQSFWLKNVNTRNAFAIKQAVVVKSRIEASVAMMLDKLSYQWVYEMPMRLTGDSASYRKPDFLINENIVIECYGSAHKPEHEEADKAREAVFLENGFRLLIIDDRHRGRPIADADLASVIMEFINGQEDYRHASF
jgi:hypothetical protein